MKGGGGEKRGERREGERVSFCVAFEKIFYALTHTRAVIHIHARHSLSINAILTSNENENENNSRRTLFSFPRCAASANSPFFSISFYEFASKV